MNAVVQPQSQARPAHRSVAIVGATGAVGIEIIKCLEERNFPIRSLRLFASPRSAGKTLPFRNQPVLIEPLTKECF
jgi:aspartate-semialdehyde dehydrogenase